MPTIVFATSKGGAGKTTSAIVLACELARQGAAVTLIDADPNQHTAKWAAKDGCPPSITMSEQPSTDTIVDVIDEAAKRTPFVIVDLEGMRSLMMGLAVTRADLVMIACQGAQDDADEAVKTIALVRSQEKAIRRALPFAVLMTRTNPALQPRTARAIISEFEAGGVPVLRTRLHDREAFRAMRSFGGTIEDLPPSEVSGIEKASANAGAFASEVVALLKANQSVKGAA